MTWGQMFSWGILILISKRISGHKTNQLTLKVEVRGREKGMGTNYFKSLSIVTAKEKHLHLWLAGGQQEL